MRKKISSHRNDYSDHQSVIRHDLICTHLSFFLETGLDTMSLDELCKICMDAPVECVMLECGHMATCTACGKQLSECPICRQFVVRVVRTFKA
jgi:hypothetical protein